MLRPILLLLTLAAFAGAADIHLQVDAREISRSLLHARIEIPAAPGPLVLWYPKWIPGVHAPGGPSENIGGLRFETANGAPIEWKRDEVELNRFELTVPAGADRVVARLDYICNQPSVNSSGVDCFGNSLLGVINWNTVLLYPEQTNIDTTRASVRLQYPEGWSTGTALPGPQTKAGEVTFPAAPLRQVVDCPLIMGENFRTIDLIPDPAKGGGRKAFLHVTSESGSAIQLTDKQVANFRNLVAEALALFGGARWQEYHFLLVCSDTLPRNGLEHLTSSFNEVGEREIVDEKKFKSWPVYLLPHEFVHAWCGKFRRPAGMVTTTFHQPERTKLLWIYEGLTQYLGEVLTVRSGLYTLQDHLPAFASKLDWLQRQNGRAWRSVEDTATSSWQLRGHSVAWEQLRRGQDYYDEGLLTWLEADALIREKSGGQASLDDFCQKFFAAGNDPKLPTVSPYELKEVIGILKGLADLDWEKFFAERIQRPRPRLDLDFLKLLGYRPQYSPKPSDYLKERETDRKQVSATASIGLVASEEGKVNSVTPGSVADKAGLAPTMSIAAVNGRKFSGQRLRDGIAESVAKGNLELLIVDGDRFRPLTLDYNGGPRYLELTRHPDHADTLAAILKNRTEPAKEK
jgi:predicted metalloprotease with PDZ domain